ncbi:unnamed protein product [Meganyctiphanes norvegica]|uniref:Lipase domain-containing protein n=1 Tax=Meganyctiphanes norvegica TaxID=48144 RepID=A0AAV2RI77_MEGNR
MKNILIALLLALATSCLACSGPDPPGWSSTSQVRSYSPPVTPGNISTVTHHLWTRSNFGDPDYYVLYPLNKTSLEESPFNPEWPTYFFFHGGHSNAETHWCRLSKTEMLIRREANVFSTDYGHMVTDGSEDINDAVNQVANLTAAVIDWLHEETGLLHSQVHSVGHSLGGNTAGLVGFYLKGKLGRLTVMDPSKDTSDPPTVDTSYASYVDVWHTNGGPVSEGAESTLTRLGHVDFYVNGGTHQAGCPQDYTDFFAQCSHCRASDFWVESINADPPFTAWPCDSWDDYQGGLCQDCGQGCLDMGPNDVKRLNGTYYLRTAPEPPFALGDQQ